MGMDERTGLQCEGGNVRCIASSHFECHRLHQKQSAEAVTSNSQFTTKWQPVLRRLVAFLKTSFKHRLIQIKGYFTKLTLHLYFKCVMYYAGLLFCSIYCL